MRGVLPCRVVRSWGSRPPAGSRHGGAYCVNDALKGGQDLMCFTSLALLLSVVAGARQLSASWSCPRSHCAVLAPLQHVGTLLPALRTAPPQRFLHLMAHMFHLAASCVLAPVAKPGSAAAAPAGIGTIHFIIGRDFCTIRQPGRLVDGTHGSSAAMSDGEAATDSDRQPALTACQAVKLTHCRQHKRSELLPGGTPPIHATGRNPAHYTVRTPLPCSRYCRATRRLRASCICSAARQLRGGRLDGLQMMTPSQLPSCRFSA